MDPVMETMRQRRSVRAYTDQPVPPYQLREILQAGQFAPSGGNCQYCHFLCIQSPSILQALIDLAQRSFSQMDIKPGTYKSLAGSIRKAKAGGYDFTYGAPVLIVVANRIDHGNAMADSACALENMMLAAASFGLGSCWINQLRWLRDDPALRAYLLSLGLADNETVYGGLALGHAAHAPQKPPARTGNRITWL